MISMQTLLLQLPIEMPSAQAAYGMARLDTAHAGQRLQGSHTPLGLLPPIERTVEVVAIVPAAALSWHRVSLPAGLGRSGNRLQAALAGLLEERLLQDPAQLHLALAPAWGAGEPAWVAACDKAWLHAHLQALELAGVPVQRIVPELAPPTQGQVWHALGDENSGWLWCRSAEDGVTGWPLAAAAQLPTEGFAGASVQAEPALAQWAQTRLHTSPELVDTASHWHTALASGWDLAQFELQEKLRARGWQKLRRGMTELLTQAQWRPARWGLLALLAAQLLGLNAWAWMTQRQWDAQQSGWTSILQQSFPKVTVVVDAPLQMAREVGRLRQGSGQLGAQDFEAMLHALGSALPAGAPSPAGLTYQDGSLQWPALTLNATQKTALEQALQRQGYRLQSQDTVWRLQTQEGTR